MSVTNAAPGVRTFTCPNCGAMQTFDPTQRSLVCPFCGTPVVLDQDKQAPGAEVPTESRFIVPFAVPKERSVEMLRTWLGGSFFAPNDLKARAALDAGKGVYIPFYRFDCTCHSNWTGEYSQTQYRTEWVEVTDSEGRTRNESRQVPYTVWYPQNGEHDGRHMTLVTASTGLTQAEADALLPFPQEEAKPDSPDYLAGFTSEEPHFTIDDGWRNGEGRIMEMERQACAQMTERLRSVNTIIQDRVGALVWLPIWLYGYTYNNNHFRVVVNGQTGEVQGQRPTSPVKIAVVTIAATLVIILAIVLIVMSRR
jgi:hypothetical protein